MEINIKKLAKPYHFTATNGEQNLQMAGSPKLVEDPVGFRPTELVLSGLGGCMSIDVLNILEKSRQQVDEFDVQVTATRREEVPGLFKDIVISIIVKGDVKQSKLEQAIRLSEEKFCTVYKIVEKTANIKTVYVLNGVEGPSS